MTVAQLKQWQAERIHWQVGTVRQIMRHEWKRQMHHQTSALRGSAPPRRNTVGPLHMPFPVTIKLLLGQEKNMKKKTHI